MSQELNESMRTRSHQRENINKETEIIETQILEWERTITHKEKNHQRGSTRDLNPQKREAVDLKTHSIINTDEI